MYKYIIQIIKNNLLCIPLIFYIGERSYIAQDEGYYALQAKWILEKSNWLAPLWWEELNYDRTSNRYKR